MQSRNLVGICLVRCLNVRYKQTAWSVSPETTGHIINTKDVKKQEAVLSLKYIEVVLQVKT